MMSLTPLKPLWHGFSYFSHQQEGVHWMLNKETTGTMVATRDGKSEVPVRGGFQCDDMGLGKTIQIVGTMVNHIVRNTLLIAPLAMIETWSSICMKAGMLVYEVDKTAPYTNPWKCMNKAGSSIPRHFIKCRPAVYVCNYEKLSMSPSFFKKEWDRVVLDEAHKIRNGSGEVACAARTIHAPIRWAVTGTPLVNSLKDIVSLMAFMGVPYSPLWTWEPRYLPLLPELVIHRTLNDLRNVIKGAPPIPNMEMKILPFTSLDEEEFYHGVQGASESMMLKYKSELLSSTESFKLLLRLRQISVHPQVYINAKRREDPTYVRPNWDMPSTKMSAIKNIMVSDYQDETTKDDVHKYIVFCQFHDEMSIIRQNLIEEGLALDKNILLYHGGLNQAERTAVLKKSKETTETTVLLLQLQAGGVGLNLQEYDRIIFVSPYWTAALMDQAIARAVRMGQTKVVKVFHLHLAAEHDKSINIDEMVNAKAEEKRKMLNRLFVLCNNEVNALKK